MLFYYTVILQKKWKHLRISLSFSYSWLLIDLEEVSLTVSEMPILAVPTPPKEKACSQKSGNVANVRTSRQGAKKLQFLFGCNF